MNVLVTGATGFLGYSTATSLLEQGHSVRGISRKKPSASRDRARVEYITNVDVGEPGALKPKYFEEIDAIVHLVGVIQERRPKQTFNQIHIQGTNNVVGAAKEAGFKGRFVYMSAIGAGPHAPAHYSRSKFAAEEIVKSSGFPYTILRPSIVLGKGGEFVQQMKDLVLHGGLAVRLPFPFIPVPGTGKNLFQPIYVADLMTCLMKCVAGEAATNEIVELGGAMPVTFDEIVKSFARRLGTKKPILHMPIGLLSAIAPLMGFLPNPPFTKDQLKNLSRDNVCDITKMKQVFGVEPKYFEETMTIIFN